MLRELRGKGGRICQPALDGKLRCPLIVRPTSEDVVTGHLFGTLQAIAPRWWLPQMLNHGLRAERFRSQVFRNLRIALWTKKTAFEGYREMWGGHHEGKSEIDVSITWDNPPTAVYIEMKFRSDLSAMTTHNDGRNGFPADQLLRNARVGLFQTGWYRENRLFDERPRDFVLLLINPLGSHPLVETYRNSKELLRGIPQSHRIPALPRLPFIGCLGYRDIIKILAQQKRWMSPPERVLCEQLCEYLEFKLGQLNLPPG